MCASSYILNSNQEVARGPWLLGADLTVAQQVRATLSPSGFLRRLSPPGTGVLKHQAAFLFSVKILMRTTITIDNNLSQELMQLTGAKSITAAIRIALDDYLAGLRKQKLLALRGQVDVQDNWQALRQLDTAP